MLDASFIKETSYLEWVFNVVIVKKANGKWQICINFTNLIRAYLKDSYPLLRIDQIMDATLGYDLLSFMDAFFDYHQI